jgi:hypothetical protein
MPFIESNSKRILFVHIPRTGGTSIEKSLNVAAPLRFFCPAPLPFLRVTPQHLTFLDMKSLFGTDFFEYSFTIVRDPYRRVESVYDMRAAMARERFIKDVPPFTVWLQMQLSYASKDSYHLDGHIRPQTDFIGSGMKIFKYESGLQAIVGRVSEQTGIPLQLPEQRYLQSKSAGRIVWDYDSLSLVNKFYADDFRTLKYNMQIPELREKSSGELEL